MRLRDSRKVVGKTLLGDFTFLHRNLLGSDVYILKLRLSLSLNSICLLGLEIPAKLVPLSPRLYVFLIQCAQLVFITHLSK